MFHLHGGGFVVGSAASAVGLASGVARAAGARAVVVEYRLAPEHPFPAGLDDVVSAYAGLLGQGVDPASVAVTGESAGANLALAGLLSIRDEGLPLPACCMLMSPFVDLTLEPAEKSDKAEFDPALSVSALRRRLSEYLAGARGDDAAVSPIRANLRGLPPLLVQAGSYEVLLDDAVELTRRAAHADVDVTLEVTAEVPHFFQARVAVLDEARAAVASAGRFIRSHRGSTTS